MFSQKYGMVSKWLTLRIILKISHSWRQILFLLYIWKPHVILNQPAQTDWQTTSLRKCLMCHQVSTLSSFPLWSKSIILHLCKYICAAYLFICCCIEWVILYSFLTMYAWRLSIVWKMFLFLKGIHRVSPNALKSRTRICKNWEHACLERELWEAPPCHCLIVLVFPQTLDTHLCLIFSALPI